MSHISIHYCLDDFKDFILSVFHDAILLYNMENNDTLFIWCLTYIKLIKLNAIQKAELKKIAYNINNHYNPTLKLYNYDDHNNIILFTQHIWQQYLNRDINVDLHIISSQPLFKNIFKSKPVITNIKNIEVIKTLRKSEDFRPVKKTSDKDHLESALYKSASIDNIQLKDKLSAIPEIKKEEKPVIPEVKKEINVEVKKDKEKVIIPEIKKEIKVEKPVIPEIKKEEKPVIPEIKKEIKVEKPVIPENKEDVTINIAKKIDIEEDSIKNIKKKLPKKQSIK
jgi:hypothetical protein